MSQAWDAVEAEEVFCSSEAFPAPFPGEIIPSSVPTLDYGLRGHVEKGSGSSLDFTKRKAHSL